MKKNEEITKLAEEIMIDITEDRLPLNNILLKVSRLCLLLNIPKLVELFKSCAKQSEEDLFVIGSFNTSMASAKSDRAGFERGLIKSSATKSKKNIAYYKTEAYSLALKVHDKWQFGNIAESIFEKKRKKTELVLREIFPDTKQRLNSIKQNIESENPEDWKNAVTSCRALFMDISDILNPPKNAADKNKYINRLKDFVSPLVESKTKGKLLKIYLDEIKKRIEYTSDLTQGSAHKDRPTLEEAEDVILYTYLVISELMSIYREKCPPV